MRKKEPYEKRMFWLKAILMLCLFIIVQVLYGKASQYFSKLFYSKSGSEAFKQYQFDEIIFSYPTIWDIALTPSGNHGDMDVVAILTIPFKSLPDITVAKQEFDSGDVYKVAEWADARVNGNQAYDNSPLVEFNSNGLFGLTMMYTYKIETPFRVYTIKCKDLYLDQEEGGLVFSFCSDIDEWDEYESLFNKIIDNIKPANQ